ncbi:MAG: AMP-binding protein, partial [Calditrichae bacterium]|nr:AMP-binding protein [Calditrichia bacterium]
AKFGNHSVYKERTGTDYQGISWSEFYTNLLNIAANLREYGFSSGDKMVIFSRNRLEMLELELAVMASGGIAVPIFANYNQETAELLITHSDARFLAISGEQQLRNISPALPI